MRSKRKVGGAQTKKRSGKGKYRRPRGRRRSKKNNQRTRCLKSVNKPRRHYKGGEGIGVIPFQQKGYTCGTSASSEALCTRQQQNQSQNEMNNKSSSGGSGKICGDIPTTPSTVPNFTGPAASGVTSANTVSQGSNGNLLQAKASGCRDSYATEPATAPPPPLGMTTKIGGRRGRGHRAGRTVPLGGQSRKRWKCYSGGKTRRVRYKK